MITKRITVKVYEDDLEIIKRIAKKDNISINDVMALAFKNGLTETIQEYLEEIEEEGE